MLRRIALGLGLLLALPFVLVALLLAGRGAVGVAHHWEHAARADDRALRDHHAVTYYVSPAGDDRAAGTSPDAPLRTLAAASRLDLGPGDRVLLQGGATHAGPLRLDAERVAFVPGHGRVLPENAAAVERPRDWRTYYTPELAAHVRRNDALLFRLFPDYDL